MPLIDNRPQKGCRIYLTGPITGVPDYADMFAIAASQLRSYGYEIFNPAVNTHEGRTFRDYMAIDLPEVVAADAVVALPGWRNSKGSNVEIMTAAYCSIPVLEYAENESLPGGFELVDVPVTPQLPFGVVAASDEDGRNVNVIAEDLIHGDRRNYYGHPFDDYTRVATMVNGAFAHKFKEGESFSAADIPIIVILMKISRQMHRTKRDNLIDIAGYCGVIDMILNHVTDDEDWAAKTRKALADICAETCPSTVAIRPDLVPGQLIRRKISGDGLHDIYRIETVTHSPHNCDEDNVHVAPCSSCPPFHEDPASGDKLIFSRLDVEENFDMLCESEQKQQ